MYADAKALLTAAQQAKTALSPRPHLPVLASLLIDFHNITGTDMDTWVSPIIYGARENLVPVCIPANALIATLKRLSGRVTCTTSADGKSLTLADAKRSFTLAGFLASDYPMRVFPQGDATVILALAWREMYAHVSPAIGTDETRVALTNVLLERKGGSLRMVATDSYRLATAERDTGYSEAADAVLPARFMSLLDKFMGKVETFTLTCDDKFAWAIVNGVDIVARLLDNPNYPKWRQLVDFDGYATAVTTCDRKALLGAVQAINLPKMTHNAPLRLHYNGQLSARMIVQDIYTAEETLPYGGDIEDFEIGVNPDFLAQGLATFDSDKIFIEYHSDWDKSKREPSPKRPLTITDGRDQYLLMPIVLK